MVFKRILEKQKLYEAGKDTLYEVTIESYNNAFEVEFTHNSTAIEENTLILMELKWYWKTVFPLAEKHLEKYFKL